MSPVAWFFVGLLGAWALLVAVLFVIALTIRGSQ